MIQYDTFVNYKMILDDSLVLKELMEYLERKSEGSIMDYIIDFCHTKDYRLEEVALIIKKDSYLKKIIEMDCKSYKIFRTENPKLDDW